MNLIKHIESHLGIIKNSWQLKNNKIDHLQVLKFENQPFDNLITYTTLGLSNIDLFISDSKTVRQEIVFTVKKNVFEDEAIASFLLTFLEHVFKSEKALLRGELIGPGKELFKGTNCNSIYCTIPVFFKNSFHVFENSNPKTVFVWLLPLLPEDAIFINKYGWNAFEDNLEKEENQDFFWKTEEVFIK